jgi:hypothetical protein
VSLAGRFQEALDACEGAGRCETPAQLMAPELLRKTVRFDVPQPGITAPEVLPVAATAPLDSVAVIPPATGGGVFPWLAGKKGWVGAAVGLVVVALLAAAAMYVRKHWVRPLLFGGDKPKPPEQGPMTSLPPPPVIPAFARRRVRFKEQVKSREDLLTVPEAPPPGPAAVPLPPQRRKERSKKQSAPAPTAVPQSPSSEDELESPTQTDPGYEAL